MATGSYIVPPKLRFYYPCVPASAESANEAAEVERMHQAIDEVLVELMDFVLKSLVHSHTEHAADGVHPASPDEDTDVPYFRVKDLLVLLKFAPTFEHAEHVEKFLAAIDCAHPSPDIRALMRHEAGATRRGNLREAIDLATHACSLDPRFAAGFNHRAENHRSLKEYDACIENAEKALAIFPDHWFALCNLGLAYGCTGIAALFS